MTSNRGHQFYQRYTDYYLSKVLQDYTHRNTYKHWNNWCFRGGNGLYCFDKGYDEDYAKRVIRMTEKPIFNTVNGLKYVFDENIDKSTYDEENSTIRMCKKDWEKFKKELSE